MACTVYEYPTPCLGGYVQHTKIFLTFPHWGVQCIDTKSSNILSTWNRPSAEHQFTSPITYSNDKKWLISGVYNNGTKQAEIALWNLYDLQIRKQHRLSVDQLKENEVIIRILHSHICHHYFIIVTNFGNLIVFNPNTKQFDYPANARANANAMAVGNHTLINVKLHDPISSSSHHKKLTHISLVWEQQSMIQIVPISYNAKNDCLSVHDSHQLALPKRLFFYSLQSDHAVGDDDGGDDDGGDEAAAAEEEKEDVDTTMTAAEDNDEDEDDDGAGEMVPRVMDYDWCLDTNHLLLLTTQGVVECYEYVRAELKQKQWRYTLKYAVPITDQVDISSMMMHDQKHGTDSSSAANRNELLMSRLYDDNLLFAKYPSSLLALIRLQFIEASQFVVVGPCAKDYNTLKLWTFQSQHGLLRDTHTLMAQNIHSKLLRLAPIISVRRKEKFDAQNCAASIDVYVVTDRYTLSVQLPSFGKSLLDLVEMSMMQQEEEEEEEEMEVEVDANGELRKNIANKDWTALRVLLSRTHELDATFFYTSMVDVLVEHQQWHLLQCFFARIVDHNESSLLYLISLMIAHLKYFAEHAQFVTCLNTILGAKINDIFMRRCIQILPQSQVQLFVTYLCHLLKLKQKQKEKQKNETVESSLLTMDVVTMWIGIILDAHLGTLAFVTDADSNAMQQCMRTIVECMKGYDDHMQCMMHAQANIHSILHEMKSKLQQQQKQNLRNVNTAKAMHGIGGGAFDIGNDLSHENDANLYKDYVVEYIKL